MVLQNSPAAGFFQRFTGFLAQGGGRLVAAALLASFVVAMRPLSFFLQSSQEISVRTADVFAYAAQLFALAALPLLVAVALLSLASVRVRETVTALLLAAAVALWIQGYFFLWDYGALDGKPLDFAAFTWHGWAEIAAWVATFALFLRLRQRVAAFTKAICLVVAASVGLGAATAYANLPPEAWHKRYEVKLDDYFQFSKKKNVLVIVFDSSRSDVFTGLFAAMTPQEKAVFDGFTFFRNTTGTFTATNPAVSGFLTGKLFDYHAETVEVFPGMFNSDSSLPLAMKRAGFVSEVYPYNMGSVHLSPDMADNLRDKGWTSGPAEQHAMKRDLAKLGMVARFNFSPHFVKRALFDSSEMYAATAQNVAPGAPVRDDKAADAPSARDDLPPAILAHLDYDRHRIEGFRSKLTFRDEPVFKYLHFHGPHPPFIHDENYNGKHLPFTMDSYTRQFKGSLMHFTQALVGSLKQAGVYDNTMLVILGDHGVHVPDPGRPANNVHEQVADILRPLLMVKPFGPAAGPLKTTAAPVSLFDVPATVLEGNGLAYAGEGRSVFRVAEDAKRPREAYALASRKQASMPRLGAFIYAVNGDVHDPASWKVQPSMLRVGKGRVPVDPQELESTLERLQEVLSDTSRHAIKD